MYERNENGCLIVKAAWMIPQLPMSLVVELPDGTLKFFGVVQRGAPPADSDLREYKGYHPNTIPTAQAVTRVRLVVFGLADATEARKQQ